MTHVALFWPYEMSRFWDLFLVGKKGKFAHTYININKPSSFNLNFFFYLSLKDLSRHVSMTCPDPFLP